MKIKMNESFATPHASYAKGQVYDVPDELGNGLINGKTAVLHKDENDKPVQANAVTDKQGSTVKMDAVPAAVRVDKPAATTKV